MYDINYETLKKIIMAVVLVVLLILIVVTSLYTVNETEQAMITTFGKLTSIEEAGLHIKAPWPIQKRKKVAVNRTQKLQIGYYSEDEKNTESIESESKMITGDYNIVNVDFFIEWKISDPYKYLYKFNDPSEILKMISQSSARSIIGSKNVDDILTTGKSAIQAEIKEKILAKLQEYDLGIQIIDVKIQDSEPPTEEVILAFKEVETAKQEKETRINEAMAYQNKTIPQAESNADKMVRDAESYKESRINEANGQVSKFNAMYEEYIKNKEINKTRMYFETLEQILPGITVYIEAADSANIDKMLPLKSFTNGGND